MVDGKEYKCGKATFYDENRKQVEQERERERERENKNSPKCAKCNKGKPSNQPGIEG